MGDIHIPFGSRVGTINAGAVDATAVAVNSIAQTHLDLGGETLDADAAVISPTEMVTLLTSDGADTCTLADGTYAGQMKMVKVVTNSGGAITLTPANLLDGTSVTLDAALDAVILVWDGTNWSVMGGVAYAIA